MADEFVIFLVGGLAIIGILFVVFGFGVGAGFAGQSGFDNYFVTSPVIVGQVPVDSVQTLVASFSADNFLRTDAFDLGSRKISNGLLFGELPVKLNLGSSERTSISFDVTGTNGYGNLVIKIDGVVVLSQHLEEGHYEFDLGKGELLELSAENSEWRIWAPTIYELENVRVFARSYPRELTTYTFETNRADLSGARMDFYMTSNSGILAVKLNGDVVYNGAINNEQSVYLDTALLDDVNILSFEAGPDSRFDGRATLALTHRALEMRSFVADINMTNSEYLAFNKGTISFDVANIYTPGGYTVSIVNNGQILLKEYAKLEKGYFLLNVDQKTLRAGLNQFIVTPLEGATFTIQSFNTNL